MQMFSWYSLPGSKQLWSSKIQSLSNHVLTHVSSLTNHFYYCHGQTARLFHTSLALYWQQPDAIANLHKNVRGYNKLATQCIYHTTKLLAFIKASVVSFIISNLMFVLLPSLNCISPVNPLNSTCWWPFWYGKHTFKSSLQTSLIHLLMFHCITSTEFWNPWLM